MVWCFYFGCVHIFLFCSSTLFVEILVLPDNGWIDGEVCCRTVHICLTFSKLCWFFKTLFVNISVLPDNALQWIDRLRFEQSCRHCQLARAQLQASGNQANGKDQQTVLPLIKLLTSGVSKWPNRLPKWPNGPVVGSTKRLIRVPKWPCKVPKWTSWVPK